MGRPRQRQSATIRGSGSWKAVDPKTGRVLLTAAAGEAWTLRRIPAKRNNKKSKVRLEFHSSAGRVAAVPGDVVLLKPIEPANSALTLVDDPDHSPRSFRGDLEFALFAQRRTIRVVNIVGLEDYTHGVVSAEMPQRSPFEALKAQAVVARTHALFIKTVTRRHRKEGYDLCDEQHCQVYGGRRAETERTRAVVVGTRGRVAVYQGKPAHVIYSSHCGGRTQSGSDIGWGDVPYWKSVGDSDAHEAPPASPLELRRFLSDWPQGFDRPSTYVHPAHARWTRAIPAKALEEKLDRKFKIGKLRGLRVLRRVPSGHVASLLIIGSRKNKTLKDEMEIRSLLGVGSLRSTLFVVDTEYRKDYQPAAKPSKGKKAAKPSATLTPDTFVFRGGGWGHAVGLCQSGAMGRAAAGQSYEAIVKAYFPGVEIGDAGY
jgi:SpoIID/LytB domain protein